MSSLSCRRYIPLLCFVLSFLLVCAVDSSSSFKHENNSGFEALHDAVRKALDARNTYTARKLRRMDYFSRLRGIGKSLIADANAYVTTTRSFIALLVPTPTDRAKFGTFIVEKSTDLRVTARHARKRWTKYAHKASELYKTECMKGPFECANRHIRTFFRRFQTENEDHEGSFCHLRRPLFVKDDAAPEKSLYSTARDFARECRDRRHKFAAKARNAAKGAWHRIGKIPHADTVRSMSASVREAAPPQLSDLLNAFMEGVGLATSTAKALATRAAVASAAFAKLSLETLGNECISRREPDMYPVHSGKFVPLEAAMVCLQVAERWVGKRAAQVYRMTIDKVGNGGLRRVRNCVARFKTHMMRMTRQFFVSLVARSLGFKGHFPLFEARSFGAGVAVFVAGVLLVLWMLQRYVRPRHLESCTSEDCYCGECPDELDENGEPVCTSFDCYCGYCSDAESLQEALQKRGDQEDGEQRGMNEEPEDDDEELLLQEVEGLKHDVQVAKNLTKSGNTKSAGSRETRAKVTSSRERGRPVQRLSYVDPRIKKPVNVRYEST